MINQNNFIFKLKEIILKSTFEVIFNVEKYTDEPDEENLHQVRVSARKLENLFNTFGKLSTHADYNSNLKLIKNLIKLFSSSREVDVCINMVVDYFRIVKSKSLVFENFFEFLQRQSQNQRSKIFKSKNLKNFIIKKDTLEKFVRFEMFSDLKNMNEHEAREYIMNTIPVMYTKLLKGYKDVILNPCKKEALHKMRLKAKPLKYTTELAINIFNANFRNSELIITKFVNTAGYIHDIDMLIKRVESYNRILKKIKRKQAYLVKDNSLNIFSKYLIKNRNKMFKMIKQIIIELNSDETRQKLFSA